MRLSVIVPVYNGARLLDQCLQSLGRSEFRDYECIVVDDGSTQMEDTRAVAVRHGAIFLPLDRRGGPGRARNRGAERAGGEILVFVDADVCAHTDTLARIDAHFRTHPDTDAVMGSYDDTPADPHFVSQYKNLFHHYIHHTSRAQASTFWAGCGAVRRQCFLDAGGFDEAYTRPCIEDIELGMRLRAHGQRIDLDPRIQCTHLKRWTLPSLLRSDVCDRGVPWLRLMLRRRNMPPDLNVTAMHRMSVVLVFGLVFALVAALSMVSGGLGARLPSAPHWLLVGAALAAALTVLNRDVYAFFARKRGWAFAARALLLHWLYYFYCGVAVLIALCLHSWDTLTGGRRRAGLAKPGTSASP